MKTKEAQISALGVNIDMYKAMSYADFIKQLDAQKQVFERSISEYEQRLTDVAGQLEAKAREVAVAQARIDVAVLRGTRCERSSSKARRSHGRRWARCRTPRGSSRSTPSAWLP